MLAAAQDQLKRKPGEPLRAFAARILPKGMELAHQPVEGRFGPGAGNVVMLFRRTDDADSNYIGWVLTPQAKHVLPKMREIPAHFQIEVQSVFYANADSDAAAELFVLYSYHRNGSQDDDSTAVYVYDWTGKEFVYLESLKRSGRPEDRRCHPGQTAKAQSWRKAIIGSTNAALSAGPQHAISAVPVRIAATAAKICGS